MARRFLPTLLGAARRQTESKVVAPFAYSQYYASVAGYGHTPTRDWPIERAIAEGYDRVMWVFKSVNTIAADSARLPYRLRDGFGEDARIVDDHPLYRVLNRKANPLETGQIFRKRLSAQILLSKRGAFVEVTKSNGGSILRLDLLPPDRVLIVPDSSGGVDHFELSKRNGEVKNLDPDKVRWFRDPHPIDPYSGTTPLESAGMSIELDHFARLYNVAFMRNDGRPGGVLAVRKTDGQGGDIDPVQMDRIEERFGKGPQEAGKLSVVAGDLSYVDIAAKPRDLQYGQTSNNARMEILGAFGIGESVFGNAAGRTFDNADNELYVYWTRTLPPHHDILTTGFDEDSEDELTGFLDTAEVEILERAAKAKRAEAREEVGAGVRSLLSYFKLAKREDEIESTPHTRALYIPTGKTPLPSTAADAEALGLAPPVDTGAGEPPAIEGPAPTTVTAEQVPGPGEEPDAAGTDVPDGTAPSTPGAAPAATGAGGPAQAALRAVAGKSVALRAIEGGRPKVTAAYRLSRKAPPDAGHWAESVPDEDEIEALERQVAVVLATLTERWTERAVARLGSPKQRKGTRHWTPEYAHDTRVGTKALDTAKAVDEATWQAEAEQATHPVIMAAAIAAATALLAEMGVTPPPGWTLARMAAESVAHTVLGVVGMVGRAAANQAARLIGDVNRLDQDDADLDTIVGHVRERAGRLASWGEAVGVHVATAVTNGARDDAAREANRDENLLIERGWYSRRDNDVRPTHRRADGQVRNLDEPFIVGDSLLRFPGDPLAPIHETANCRCRLKHRHKRTGRWVSPPAAEAKALPRDGDADGFIYDGTPRQAPAPLRLARGNEAGVAKGAAKVAGYADEAREWRGIRFSDDVAGEEWRHVERTLHAMFDVSFTTSSGRNVRTEISTTAHGPAEADDDMFGEDDDASDVFVYEVNGDFIDSDTGEPLGSFGREVIAYPGGGAQVAHSGMTIEEWAQGDGIASEFNAHAFAWYRQMGVTEVNVNATGTLHQSAAAAPRFTMTVSGDDNPVSTAIRTRGRRPSNGGYTWGQQGFDFYGDAFMNTLPGTLVIAEQIEPGHAALLRKWDALSAAERAELLGWLELPFIPDSWFEDPDNRDTLARMMEQIDPEKPPTPYELNLLGADKPYTDPESAQSTWLGKALMARSSWTGYFDPAWLDPYMEAKSRRTRRRLLGAAFLSALAAAETDDTALIEAKSLRAWGSAAAHGVAQLEARAWTDNPRDGDGDGFVYDGTARQRPATPRFRTPTRASMGRPWAEVLERERTRRAERERRVVEAANAVVAAVEPDPVYLVPQRERTYGEAETSARMLVMGVERHVAAAGADLRLLDMLITRAHEYDADPSADRLAALLAVLAEIRDLRNASGGPLLAQEDLGDEYAALSGMHTTTGAKSVYTGRMSGKTIHRGTVRDGDGDGFVDDGKPTMRRAPTATSRTLASGWRRRPGGYMSADGEFFIERGAPMTGANTDAWMILRRVPEDRIGRDSQTAYDTRNASVLWSVSAEGYTSTEDADYTGPLYAHTHDAGSYAEAKYTVSVLRAEDAPPAEEADYRRAGYDSAAQKFGALSVEQIDLATGRVRTALDKMEPGSADHETMSGALDWLEDTRRATVSDETEDIPEQDPAREAVYAAEAALPTGLRMRAISDEEAAAIASEHVGEQVTILRTEHSLGGTEKGRHLFGVWLPGGPVIAVPPEYPLSPFEVYHETAHLLTSRGDDVNGHGAEFQREYLRIAPDALADRLRPGFPDAENDTPSDPGGLPAELAALVAEARGDTGQLGVCGRVTSMIEDRYGYPKITGFYSGPDANGDHRWLPHAWNMLPNGDVLDATADQFGYDQTRIVPAGDAEAYQPFTDAQRAMLDRYVEENMGRQPDAEDWALLLADDDEEPEVEAEAERPVAGIWEQDMEGISSTRAVALMYDMGGIMGYFPLAWLTWDPETSTVEGVYVNEDYRGRGIATELLAKATELHGGPLLDSGEYTQAGYEWAKKRDLDPTMRTRISKADMAKMQVRMNSALMGGGRNTGDPLWVQPAPPADAEAPDPEPAPEPAPRAKRKKHPDFGKRIGVPERRPLAGGGYLLIEKIQGAREGQVVERVIWRVERRDGVWGVYPPTEQSPAVFQTGSKREAERWADEHDDGKVPEDD